MIRINSVGGVLALALLLLSTGCQPLPEVRDTVPAPPPPSSAAPEKPQAPPVPTGKMTLFQEAVHILYETIVETFLRIEELERKFTVMALDVDERLELDSFTPVLEGRKRETLTDLRFREAAAEVMADYAWLLRAVSAGAPPTAVDAAAEKLAGSLGVLTNAAVPDGIGEAEIVGIFDGVMTDLDRIRPRAETDRTAALTILMTAAQVDVQRLSSLIVRDQGKFQSLVKEMIRRIVESANERRPLHEDYVDPKLTEYDNRIAALVKESEEIRAALDIVMDGFDRVPAAHFAIRNLLGKGLKGLPPLQRLLQKARQAERQYRILETQAPPLP
jgi:hypothetical protein